MSREMKDSGVEWLGEIPKGWNVKKGKALYSITTGKLDANAEEPTGIYPFFTCSMFPKKINQYAFDCEALLVAGNGVVGFTQYYKGKFNAYQRTYVLSDFHNIYPLFLKYYVSNNLKREVEQSSVGSVIQFIKLGDLQNFNIAFPEYKEQEKITEYLEMKCQKIDHIIEKTKSSIVEYKKFKQSIITQAVTKGIVPERLMKECDINWIGKIPQDWKVQRGKNLFIEINERSTTGEEELLTVSHWSKAKRAVTSFINNRDYDSKAKAAIRKIFGLGEKEKAKASRLLTSAVDGGYIKVMDPDTAPRYKKYIPYWA